jgi:hypothetical protein
MFGSQLFFPYSQRPLKKGLSFRMLRLLQRQLG